MVRAARFVTLGAFLLNLQGPAWAALSPAFGGLAGARVAFTPPPVSLELLPPLDEAGRRTAFTDDGEAVSVVELLKSSDEPSDCFEAGVVVVSRREEQDEND